jgi:urea transport system permease protein
MVYLAKTIGFPPPMNLLRRLLLFVLLVAPALPAAAQADDPFAGLASQDFSAVVAAINDLAVSGNPRAGAVITALQAETLFVTEDGGLLIKTDDGYLDARTGDKVADVDDDSLANARVNNAVRSAIGSALGSLNLFSIDPAIRLKAAGDVFLARNPAAIASLDRAIVQEKDAGVLAAMEQARAAALLASPDAAEADKLAAIATIRARGGLEASSLLESLKDQPPAVAAAAADAITAMARVQQLWGVLQSIFYGLSLGSVLLLAAAGLAITFGVMGVINMAHGEMVMLGAYTTFVVQEAIRASAPSLFGASLFIAVPLAFLVSGAVGILIERCMIRFLYGRPLETLLATWGLSLALQQAVRSIFGANNRDVGTPAWMSGAVQWGGLTITMNRLTIIVFAIIVLAGLMAALRFTSLGLQMRAVTQNRRMAASMGIRTPWIDALTFGLGSGVAGMAGVALSQIDNVSPNLGQGYIIDSFMVVVFGGVGNLWGTLVSALTLGIVNKFLEPIAGAVLGKIAVLVLLILFIQRKPRGLFPLKGRAVEA